MSNAEKRTRNALVFYHITWKNEDVESDFTTLEVWKQSHQLMVDIII